MSIVSLSVLAGNPVTTETTQEALNYVAPGIKVSDADLRDYTGVLASCHDGFQAIMNMPAYFGPDVDEKRFPRENVHRPAKEDNAHNFWAYKVSIKDQSEQSAGGLLKGKKISLKDNISVKGVPSLLGTDIFTDYTPKMDATVVTRTLEAGGEIVGKAVCENMSLFGASCSAATGPMSNYYAEGYSAGGSTSGGALSVAHGEVDIAIGGDQGGSIRLPASHNGIVGLKPTFGLIPYTGIAALESYIDYTGPLAKTTKDCALMLEALAGADGLDQRQLAGTPLRDQVPQYSKTYSQGVKGLKVGILKESFSVPTTDERVANLVRKAAEKFAELGADVEEVSVPCHLWVPETWAVISRIGGTQGFMGTCSPNRGLVLTDLQDKLSPYDADKFSRTFVSGQNLIINGAYALDKMPPSLLGKATNLVLKARAEYDAALSKYDVLITPSMPWLPQSLPKLDGSALDKLKKTAGLSLNSNPFNATGHPAMSVPVGFLPSLEDDKLMLPAGMQIISKWFGEEKILRAGHAWETAFDWKTFA